MIRKVTLGLPMLRRVRINPKATGPLPSPLPEYAPWPTNRLLSATIAERHHRSTNAPPSKRAVKCRCTDPSLEIANTTILLPPTN